MLNRKIFNTIFDDVKFFTVYSITLIEITQLVIKKKRCVLSSIIYT